MEDSMPR